MADPRSSREPVRLITEAQLRIARKVTGAPSNIPEPKASPKRGRPKKV
jgi:hypothetical protein